MLAILKQYADLLAQDVTEAQHQWLYGQHRNMSVRASAKAIFDRVRAEHIAVRRRIAALSQ